MNMRKMFGTLGVAAAAIALMAGTAARAVAQVDTALAKEIDKKLVSLPDYAVFDSLGFAMNGNNIVLQGYASRPELKSEAEKAVKRISGVGGVENQIQVLPNSPNDDRIRMAVFRRVYGYEPLRKYSNGAPLVDDPLAVAAGGITNDPPQGFHAIHIIVNNGRVILTGVVDSKEDADMAYMQANGTPGTFAVTNDLMYPGKAGTAK
jgi:hyperosmotically inducible protein